MMLTAGYVIHSQSRYTYMCDVFGTVFKTLALNRSVSQRHIIWDSIVPFSFITSKTVLSAEHFSRPGCRRVLTPLSRSESSS